MKQETFVTLGETSRSVSTFGIPLLIDAKGTCYKHVSKNVNDILQHDFQFRSGQTVALDFKLKRARGKKWLEPPRINDTIGFFDPQFQLNRDLLCTGRISYIHLSRKRSVGLVYITDIDWIHPIIGNMLI